MSESSGSPIERLGVLATQDVAVAPGFRHLELFTMEGLLTLLWHGRPDARAAVVAVGGAMGGLLGPADGLYHDLGVLLADSDMGMIRVSYRKPNDLVRCTVDAAAAVELAVGNGAQRVVVMGHSFGGAIAMRTAAAVPSAVVGVVTFATQSAGMEAATELGDRPYLAFHGTKDELLPILCSQQAMAMAGETGDRDLVTLDGVGHLMSEGAAEIRRTLAPWLHRVLAGGDESTAP